MERDFDIIEKEKFERKPISKKLRFEVLKRDAFKCRYCGVDSSEATLHIDHIIAVANGGNNEITNLISACDACNLGKGAVPIDNQIIIPQKPSKIELLMQASKDLIVGRTVSEIRKDKVWLCDFCCDPIRDPKQAYILQKQDKKKKYELKIGHNNFQCNSYRDNDWEVAAHSEVGLFTGSNAIIEFGSFIQSGEYNLRSISEMMKRCLVPAYELAHHHFSSAIKDDLIEHYHYLSEWCFLDWQIDRVLVWLGAIGPYLDPPEYSRESIMTIPKYGEKAVSTIKNTLDVLIIGNDHGMISQCEIKRYFSQLSDRCDLTIHFNFISIENGDDALLILKNESIPDYIYLLNKDIPLVSGKRFIDTFIGICREDPIKYAPLRGHIIPWYLAKTKLIK